MTRKKKTETAAEFMARLQSDPEWVRQNAEREARHAEAVAKLRAEIKPEHDPLLAALAKVGHSLTSIYDLVNTRGSYPAAIPVLVKSLPSLRHPVLRQGVARALTVHDARGIAGRVLLQELMSQKDPPGSESRWTLANALTVAADKSMIDDIKALVADPSYADVHERLQKALKSLRAR